MIDIVIVSLNSGDYLSKYLQSIFTKFNKNVIGNVLIIYNNSTNGSLEKVPTLPNLPSQYVSTFENFAQ